MPFSEVARVVFLRGRVCLIGVLFSYANGEKKFLIYPKDYKFSCGDSVFCIAVSFESLDICEGICSTRDFEPAEVARRRSFHGMEDVNLRTPFQDTQEASELRLDMKREVEAADLSVSAPPREPAHLLSDHVVIVPGGYLDILLTCILPRLSSYRVSVITPCAPSQEVPTNVSWIQQPHLTCLIFVFSPLT